MILIGQYDSPFVRRVGIALHLYGQPYEHRPWSTFGDAAQLRAVNPLGRVPTLVLDDGTVLPDSHSILDHLDERAGAAALIAPHGAERLAARRRIALATGVADKSVSMIYERILHQAVSAEWIGRCVAQITATLAALETERAAEPRPFWHGESPGHADIALTCAVSFLAASNPDLLAEARCPALQRHAAACEALAAFVAIRQDFTPPTPATAPT